MRYVLQRGIPAVFVEIYLPKKAAFQGALFAALTEGRDPGVLRRHLDAHAAAIRNKLQGDWPAAARRLDPGLVDELAGNIGALYGGYSVYEVDGVYFAANRAEPVEERTQVIRILFQYTPGASCDEATLREVKRYLRAPANRLADFGVRVKRALPELRRVERWRAQIGVFLIGFLLHRVEQAIEGHPELRQDEIWVASSWNAVVNRFVPEQGRRG